MEVIPTIISLASKIHELVKKDNEIEYKLRMCLEKIKNELEMMNSFLMDNSSKARDIDEHLVVKLQDLAYDVEDAIDLMVIDTNKTNKAPMHLGRVLRIVGIGDRRSRYILDIDYYQKRIDGLTTKWKEFFKKGQPNNGEGTSADAAKPPPPAAAAAVDGRHHVTPVGIEEAKKDLLDLLRHVDGHPVKLRVISIVGFRGVGKTTLARAVFNERGSLGEPPFDCQAWVQVTGQPAAAAHDESMNKSNAARLLQETLRQLCPETNTSEFAIHPIWKLCHTIRTFLEGKRYLIVIDDVRHADVWSEMKDAFPTDGSSRIMVTTGVQSVATECSLGGFVYRLRGLKEKDSEELLWKLVRCERHKLPRDVQSYSGDIVRKCDGLPMALVGVAAYVRAKLGALRQGKLHCRDIARDLGMYLADGRYTAFQRARTALVDCYEGLDSHGLNLKTCLLSASMFPKRRGVRRKSLVRRWMAERLVHYDDKKDRPANIVALENLEELVDRIMIQGADDDDDDDENNPVKNKCSVQGVLLDFLLHQSATKRFARLIRNGERLDVTAINSNPARRLAVVYDTDSDGDGDTNRAKLADMVNGLDLSRVRSLTVAGTVLSDSDLKGCKLLRVLDLDGCTGVTDGVLRSICKLKVLRYLSLRGTDARGLPPEMAELRFLETLDVRDIVMPGAQVQSHDVFTVTLPWNVLRLPYLKYLFGAFELPRDIPRRRSVPWPWTTAAAASDAAGQLETLAGFFIGNGRRELQCLETLLGLMNRLKKLKIWWNKKGVTAGPKELPAAALTQLLVKFLKKRCFDLDSLSLDFGDQSLDFLNFPMNIHVPCKLRYIKLRGKLSSLPGIIIKEDSKIPSDHALTKLYLSFTGLSCEALLVLQRLPNLTYLKLVENSSGDFTDGTLTLNAGGFPSLRGLHVQAPKLPEVRIVAGDEDEAVAMQHLTTLQLLCGDVSGFQAADIDRFHQLEQVVLLKSSLDEGATKAWEAARKNHMNRPRIDTV